MMEQGKRISIGEISNIIVLGRRKARSWGKVLTTVVASMDGNEVWKNTDSSSREIRQNQNYYQFFLLFSLSCNGEFFHVVSSHHKNNTLSDYISLMIACLRVDFHSCSSLDLERRGMKSNNNDYVVKDAWGNHWIS